MSLELKDFRLGITLEIDVALTAVARAFGKEKAEVAREVLGDWAVRKLHEARVMTGLAQANGIVPASNGTQPECTGGINSGRLR